MAPQEGLDRVYVCIAATFLRYETFGTPEVATAVFQAEEYNQHHLSSFRVGE